MRAADFRRWSLALACALAGALAHAEPPCRVAFDIGSSGVRSGATNSGTVERTGIDYLAALRTGRSLDATLGPTIVALRPAPGAPGCARVGGGFSAWRLALQQDAGKLVSNLASIHAVTGVAVLVIPQEVEGSYGYVGARQLLGSRLATSHVLDIGGGSLQVAGERSTYGEALGQKVWHQHLCTALRNGAAPPCALQPMTAAELDSARALLADKLRGIPAALPGKVTMTAISRPVTQGVAPAVERLLRQPAGSKGFTRAELANAIGQLAGMTLDDTAARLDIPRNYAAYLLSDMLLVEGLLDATGGDALQVAELDLTNLPGLLADDTAFRWSGDYGCYLERLARTGLAAYASDPATCQKAQGNPR